MNFHLFLATFKSLMICKSLWGIFYNLYSKKINLQTGKNKVLQMFPLHFAFLLSEHDFKETR